MLKILLKHIEGTETTFYRALIQCWEVIQSVFRDLDLDRRRHESSDSTRHNERIENTATNLSLDRNRNYFKHTDVFVQDLDLSTN